jgi:hypothetical protein
MLRLRSSGNRVDRHHGLPLAYEVMPGNTSDKLAASGNASKLNTARPGAPG